MSGERFDAAIVGAGIVGLAFAYHAARAGLKVAVFERDSTAAGASIRNFGLVWPIGQPAGPRFERALRSAHHWQKLADKAGFVLQRSGSLHLAYRHDEWAVLREFEAAHTGPSHDCRLLSAREVGGHSPVARRDGLLGALWSGSESVVTSPRAIPAIAAYLKSIGVHLFWNHAVTEVESGGLRAGQHSFQAERIVICSGADLDTLFPKTLAATGLTRCKLQMLAARTTAPLSLGPALCAGLTLLHYPAFALCSTLPALRDRVQRESPALLEHGIHILVAQHDSGEFILGDSHHYGNQPQPFDNEAVYDLILEQFRAFADLPGLSITRRWHGIYTRAADATEVIASPADGVWLVTGLGGAGMTLSLGLAEQWWQTQGVSRPGAAAGIDSIVAT